MTTEGSNLDKVLDYTAKAIELRDEAKKYDKGTLQTYVLESVATIYDNMVRNIAK